MVWSPILCPLFFGGLRCLPLVMTLLLGVVLPSCAGEEETGEEPVAADGTDPDATEPLASQETPIVETDELPPSGSDPQTDTVDATLTGGEGGQGYTPAFEPGTPSGAGAEASLAAVAPADTGLMDGTALPATPASNPTGEVSSPGAAKNLGGGQPSAPPSGNWGTYAVKAGDSLSRISRTIFGSISHWPELAQLNGLASPYRIHPGDALKFPLDHPKAKAFAAGLQKSKKTLTVKAGDSLAKLAQQLYGNPNQWKLLYELNKDKLTDPHIIFTGLKLSYWESGATPSATAEPAGAPPGEAQKEASPKSSKKKGKKKAPISPQDLDH